MVPKELPTTWMVSYNGYNHPDLMNDLIIACDLYPKIEVNRNGELLYLFKDSEGFTWDCIDGYTYEFIKSYDSETLPYVLKALIKKMDKSDEKYWISFRTIG